MTGRFMIWVQADVSKAKQLSLQCPFAGIETSSNGSINGFQHS
jgi:hypothetical protein